MSTTNKTIMISKEILISLKYRANSHPVFRTPAMKKMAYLLKEGPLLLKPVFPENILTLIEAEREHGQANHYPDRHNKTCA